MNDTPPKTDLLKRINSDVPHSARVWNYLLGGKDNYAADREVGDKLLQIFPDFAHVAQLQREFLIRSVRYLVQEVGIRQFLDVGTGLPTANNTHEVAQAAAPETRVVYVDNDPIVLVHARALLQGSPEGATAYVEADVRDPDLILAEAAKTLDFGEPVAVMMLSIIGQLGDADGPKALVDRFMEPLVPGSHLALSDGVDANPALVDAVRHYNGRSVNTYTLRSPDRLASFFEGYELVEPGVVPTPKWRPGGPSHYNVPEGTVSAVCGVARKR